MYTTMDNPSQSYGPNDWRTYLKSRGMNPEKIRRTVVAILVVVVVAVFALSGFYFLGSNEEAVVTMFGKVVRTEKEAGLKFKVPLLEAAQKVDIEGIRRMEFGYRSDNSSTAEETLLEAQMLTADENIVIADWAVLFKVNDSYKFLYNVDDPMGTLRTITEAAYRRVVAAHILDDILTDKKETIQFEVRESLQEICNKYDFGVTITGVQLQDALPPDPVKDAFLEVASAKEDKTAKINDATTYLNEKLPVARGEATQILNQAEGYKQERINDATGAVARFLAIQKEYATNKEITRTRLYLEAIRTLLPGVKEVYIMSDNGDVLKFLPLTGTTAGLTPAAAQ
jgi:modulator of FtsH protease HflK